MMPRVTYQFINELFRGPIYGRYDIFTARSFKDFVQRNDIDLTRAIFSYDGKKPIGTIVFAQRDDRAWLSLMGVLPEYRRRGLGRELFAQAVESVRASGAKHIEFEVVQRNVAVQEMYKGFGFQTDGELYVWARKQRGTAANGLVPRKHALRIVNRIVRRPSPCWQREAVAVATTPSVLIEVDAAYAFVRLRDENAYVLDAGAEDAQSAAALVRELDARIPYELTLFNEPARSPLAAALAEGGWNIVERQFRMTG